MSKQRSLMLLLLGLLLIAFVAFSSATANAHIAQTSAQRAQRVQLEALRMIDQRTGWAVEKDRTRVFFTKNGLLRWTNVTPAALHFPPNDSANSLTAFNFLDAKHAYLGVLQQGETRLLRTQDSGKTWTTVRFDFAPFTDIGIYQITFLDVKHGWLAFDKAHGFGKYQIVLMSTSDGGKNWHQLLDTTTGPNSGLPDRRTKYFHFTSAQQGWMTGPEDATPNARLYQTTNGGKTWMRFPLPALPNAPYSVSYGPYFTNVNDGTLLVTYANQQGTSYSLLTYRTHNSGKTWSVVGPVLQANTPLMWNIQTFRNAEQGWVLGLDSNRKSIIHQTSDGGRTWKTVHPTGLQPFTEVIFDLNFWTTTQGLTIDKADNGTQTLFLTSDAGQQWHTVYPLLG